MSESKTYLFKYGGNAMTDNKIKFEILKNITSLANKGHNVVIVHGGGPFIKKALEDAGIESEFIDGHRVTTKEALRHVETALKGWVNSDLVAIMNQLGYKAVGLSGKDGHFVKAKKRMHEKTENGKTLAYDLGQVGDVEQVDTQLLNLLLQNGYIPVVTCIAADKDGNDYNINGDMFAGNVAGALNAEYIVLTDVDGLMYDKDDPSTLIKNINLTQTTQLITDKVIQGGMLPKIDSCRIALRNGATAARIINGTKPEQISQVIEKGNTGTVITK